MEQQTKTNHVLKVICMKETLHRGAFRENILPARGRSLKQLFACPLLFLLLWGPAFEATEKMDLPCLFSFLLTSSILQ
jgi:hypothetical protein